MLLQIHCLLLLIVGVQAYSSSYRKPQLSQRYFIRRPLSADKEKSCWNPCPEPEENLLEDRREAIFAALGTLLASSTPVFAEYGVDAKIELPNPYQQLNDRMTKQCLVESLGNRECLVYADENFLYKGADNKVLLERIEKASVALATIPEYVQSRQWSKINGVLTGPLGELIRTMGQVAELTDNSVVAKQKVKAVKNDLYAIADAMNRKDQALVLKNHAAATKDLVDFVKSL